MNNLAINHNPAVSSVVKEKIEVECAIKPKALKGCHGLARLALHDGGVPPEEIM